MCSVKRYHRLCRAHSPASARASVVCLATISTGSGAYFARYLNSVVHPPVLIVKIDMFREALQNLADSVNFHKRGLCVDAVVVPSRDYSEIAIPFFNLVLLLVEQYVGIDPGMGCSVVSVGLCVCPKT
jgi:ethanolamine utilization protein EutA (predicted chaperonin)